MIFISLFGGVLLLLYGIKLLNDGLQNAAGSGIRSLLRSLTSNRLTAVGAGAFITGLIQSSSATSVMLVGFVSAGLMTFRQTLGVILGADIGATLAVQLLAFHIYDYSLLLVGIGLSLVFFTKQPFWKQFGEGILGFGFVFLALKVMIEAMSPLQSNELFRQVFAALSGMPFVGIVLSAAVTALIHSSAATMGIALALAESGLIPLHAAIYVVLGANIGTCATAFIAGFALPPRHDALRGRIFYSRFSAFFCFCRSSDRFRISVAWTAVDISRQIANANTFFNVIMAAVFLPFTVLFRNWS